MGPFSKKHAADTCQPESLRPHRMRIGNIVKGGAKVNHDAFRARRTASSGAKEGDKPRITRGFKVLRMDVIRCSLTPQPKYRTLPS
jgi:hypothetical protein